MTTVKGIILILHHGYSVCVASIVRIVMMDRLVKAQDFTWAMCQVFVWSCVEPFTGIVCACLPTYAPFLRRWFTRQKEGSSGKKTPYYISDRYKVNPGSGKREWSRINANSDASREGDQVELTGTSTVNIYSNSRNSDYQMNPQVQPAGSDGSIIMVTKDISMARSAGRGVQNAV